MTETDNKPHIVAYGDIENGFSFYGPFPDLAAANEYINKDFPNYWAEVNAYPIYKNKEEKDANISNRSGYHIK